MARKPKQQSETPFNDAESAGDGKVSLSKFLSQKAVFSRAIFWLVGDTPLLAHAWSEKAKREMLEKQLKVLKPGKERRDPRSEFLSSLYMVDDETYGFPATAFKKCMLSAAHKDKGIPQSVVMRSLWIHAPFVRVRTANEEAICDLPLLRLWGSAPEMREDMVRIGAGLRKTANLAYRAQFSTWAVRIVARYNASVINSEVISTLIEDSGRGCGVGDWRNEKNGMFGAFHLATADEQKEWEKYAAGKGPLPIPPIPDAYREAAE